MASWLAAICQRLQDLIALNYDAIEAYQATVERLDDEESKMRLAEFKADHERHTKNLGAHLSAMGETRSTGRSVPLAPPSALLRKSRCRPRSGAQTVCALSHRCT